MGNVKHSVTAAVGLIGIGAMAFAPSLIWMLPAALMAAAALAVLGWSAHNAQHTAEQTLDGVQQSVDALNEQLDRARTQLGDTNLKLQLVQRSKSNTEAILKSIRDAVLVADQQDRIIMANEAAQRLFGFRFDPTALPSLATLSDAAAFVPLMQKSRTGRIAHVRHEVTLPRDGQPAVFDAVLSYVQDDTANTGAVVAVLHDVTREKEIAQMKNDFVSHVSHELKTPLASINAYAEMLVDGEAQDEDTLKQFCTIIQSQAQRLTRLIDDILNISRIESGLIKVSKDQHSMALIVRDAVEMIKSYAQEKNITVTAPAAILYDQVVIDRDMLSQVVINLLSNAVKYTPAGGAIAIASELNEADNCITVTISDTGVGIPPDDVEHVFDKFYRVEANNKMAKGTGLGLNLVKQIVETVHGGRVFVTSTIGKGSTFGFELPLAAENVKC